MSWKPKYYIVYSHATVENLRWECDTHYRCMGHICYMLQGLLNVKTIGSEIKWILGGWHEAQLVKDHGVTYQEISDYVKSRCCMLSFTAKGTRKRALAEMQRLGAKEMYLADSYGDMMKAQAHYKNHNKFPKTHTK